MTVSMRRWGTTSRVIIVAIAGAAAAVAALSAPDTGRNATVGNDRAINDTSARLLKQGREVFRFETFGDEAWWTDTIQLHRAIEGENHGGVGGGVSPATALSVGLKVDIDAVPKKIQSAIARGAVDLNDPAVTLALQQLDAVVGVKATLNDNGNSIRSMGIICALCHSTVDDSFAPGIGHRLDGWANRDLSVGLIVSLAPNLQPIADLLQTDVPTVKTVLNSWGPGRYDAWLDKDGKAFRPDGGQAGTLLPPAFGLAGVNLHTWTCHVPPLYTEPGYAIHTPAEIGIDNFQADRSPTHGYRTSPLAGLWSHQKGGFFHDGRFATLDDVVNHYDAFLGLDLANTEKRDLVQFLLSI